MDLFEELKDRVELEDETQKKILAAAPLALLGGVVIVASLLRGKPIPVRAKVAELAGSSRRAAHELANRLPRLNKPKDQVQ